jgi:hypothetical protein
MQMSGRVTPSDDEWPTSTLREWREAMMEFLLGACHDHAE